MLKITENTFLLKFSGVGGGAVRWLSGYQYFLQAPGPEFDPQEPQAEEEDFFPHTMPYTATPHNTYKCSKNLLGYIM